MVKRSVLVVLIKGGQNRLLRRDTLAMDGKVFGNMSIKAIDHREDVMEIAWELLKNKNHCDYSMLSNRWDWHKTNILTLPFTSDCSGTVTAICYYAHGNDPSGVDFAYGDTETILNHATAHKLIISRTQLIHGDFILFGSGPKPEHVAMSMQNTAFHKDPQCFSMGRQGDPSLVLLSVLSTIGKPTFVRNVTRV